MRRGTRAAVYPAALSDEERRLTGVEIIDQLSALESAIAQSAAGSGKIAVIPEGPYILPFIK
jgi:hypothetical protein